MKAFLWHMGGYKDVKARHKKEIQELAKKIWSGFKPQRLEIKFALDVAINYLPVFRCVLTRSVISGTVLLPKKNSTKVPSLSIRYIISE